MIFQLRIIAYSSTTLIRLQRKNYGAQRVVLTMLLLSMPVFDILLRIDRFTQDLDNIL